MGIFFKNTANTSHVSEKTGQDLIVRNQFSKGRLILFALFDDSIQHIFHGGDTYSIHYALMTYVLDIGAE